MSTKNSLPVYEIDALVEKIGGAASEVIPILHAIQKKYHYLPDWALRRVTEITDITPAKISGIATFYSQFRDTPVGEHIIQVCTGTACFVKGAERVYDAFRRELSIEEGNDTDADGLFTLQKVSCLGCCTIAPVVQIDSTTYGRVQIDAVGAILQDFLANASARDGDGEGTEEILPEYGEIKLGLGSCCVASGSSKVFSALQESLLETGVKPKVKRVGCVGMCHRVPLIEIALPDREPVFYEKVQPESVGTILRRHYKSPSVTQRLKSRVLQYFEEVLYGSNGESGITRIMEKRDPQVTAFLERQRHIATEFCGELDPLDLQEYIAKGGFNALRNALRDDAAQLLREIEKSGLRGRGGAGFPTGEKWRLVRNAPGEKKYILCNGDEGDPGAFMDRMILESYPFRVIEGMILAAYAVGADEGYLYIRAEYPLAVQRVYSALTQCREAGLLGAGIAGSDFSLDLNVMEGAGAFVCGEETALIASIEGNRGMPSYRPPYPSEKGLWDKPTLVNNCETYAAVPWIVRNGADEFAGLGTPKSAGTKVFSLAGKVKRGGLIEVPMGITIREIVEEIGGGIEGGRSFKAVQIGGPSGGCVPEALADTRVDYEDLIRVGAMMGSGGLLVMDENDCMVDIARYFLSFTCDQSCGKCTFCRIGTRQMLEILNAICAGEGTERDIASLEELAEKTARHSLCGLGKTAPNPVLTTLRYYRDEYLAHINGVCPAGRCKELITYSIGDACIGCTLCAQHCPASAIEATPYVKHEIDQGKCIKCNTCVQVCPESAVEVR